MRKGVSSKDPPSAHTLPRFYIFASSHLRTLPMIKQYDHQRYQSTVHRGRLHSFFSPFLPLTESTDSKHSATHHQSHTIHHLNNQATCSSTASSIYHGRLHSFLQFHFLSLIDLAGRLHLAVAHSTFCIGSLLLVPEALPHLRSLARHFHIFTNFYTFTHFHIFTNLQSVHIVCTFMFVVD